MIPSYRDHAANERTFLAWIRTGLTMMALGFVIERLDIFLASLTAGARNAAPPVAEPGVHYLSVAIVGLGIVLMAGSIWRFAWTNRAIDAKELLPYRSMAQPIVMALLVLAAGIAVLLHLLRVF